MTSPNVAPEKYAFPAYAGRMLVVEHGSIKPRFLFHYHADYELTLIRGGPGKRLVGDSTRNFAGTDLVLLGPNMPHAWAFETQLSSACPASFVAVAFRLESIGLQLLGKPELKGVSRLLRNAGRGLSFGPKTTGRLEEDMVELTHATGIDQLVTFLSILGVLALSKDRRPLVSKDYDPSLVEREHEALSRTLHFIHGKSMERISLKDAAANVNMSVPTFTRFFRRIAGTTFVAYLNEWRISRACVLLRETDYSVLEISNMVGYNNLSHFNRQFLKFKGSTPREFRGTGDE